MINEKSTILVKFRTYPIHTCVLIFLNPHLQRGRMSLILLYVTVIWVSVRLCKGPGMMGGVCRGVGVCTQTKTRGENTWCCRNILNGVCSDHFWITPIKPDIIIPNQLCNTSDQCIQQYYTLNCLWISFLWPWPSWII